MRDDKNGKPKYWSESSDPDLAGDSFEVIQDVGNHDVSFRFDRKEKKHTNYLRNLVKITIGKIQGWQVKMKAAFPYYSKQKWLAVVCTWYVGGKETTI